MKLYTFPGAPNPLRLQLYLAEKGIEIDTETVDLTKQQQLSWEYRQKNPNCDVPMLELPDGTCISQLPAIMLYLERRFPQPSLYGESDQDMGLAVMWEHLMGINGMSAVAEVLRNKSSAMAGRALVGPHNYQQIPDLVERGRKRIRDFFDDLDQRLGQRHFVAAEQFTVADITAWVSVNFARWVKELPGDNHDKLKLWYRQLECRPGFQSVMGENQR